MNIQIISMHDGGVRKGDIIIVGEEHNRIFEVIANNTILSWCSELEYWRDHVKISLSKEEHEKECLKMRRLI